MIGDEILPYLAAGGGESFGNLIDTLGAHEQRQGAFYQGSIVAELGGEGETIHLLARGAACDAGTEPFLPALRGHPLEHARFPIDFSLQKLADRGLG